MSEIIGVRFKRVGKIYYFDPDNIKFEVGDGAIVETVRGVEYGEVVISNRTVDDEEIVKPLKKVISKAGEKDNKKLTDIEKREKDAFRICNEKIAKHGLDMKLINVECTFDGNKIVFYFTADGRVDFRELVKDLASVFKTRIELRQIGVRDEAKMVGGLGPCGRPACCAVFLGDFQPVSIKMAKEQGLSLSPTKISGLCGRLMCCLNYEHEYYEEISNIMPRVGSEVRTPDGKGTVLSNNALKQLVRVKIPMPDGTFDARTYDLKDVKLLKKKRPEKSNDEPLSDDLKAILD